MHFGNRPGKLSFYYKKKFYLHENDEDNTEHLQTFRHFGIISVKYDRKTGKNKFYVTPLIKCLFEEVGTVFEKTQDFQKFLIVETNFKVYAYTKNEFELQRINFLFEVEYSFPGFIVGVITRNSTRNVLKRGLTSKWVIIYLKY